MRLSCPNCNAQYEIDAALLPENGREVQCSACNFVWFQKHIALTEEPEAPPAASAPSNSPTEAYRDSTAEQEPPSYAEDAASVSPSSTAPRTVSGDALEILRQEAEFEARRRADEGAAPGSQNDATQTDTEPRIEIQAPGPQRFAGNPADPAAAPPRDPRPPENREQTPPKPKHDVMPTPARQPGRRRTGLFLTVLALFVFVYVFAPGIITAMPEAEALITNYVATIDELWLQIRSFLDI